MTTFEKPFLCVWCKHLRRDDTPDPMTFLCEAYPNGIPGAILSNHVDHRDPQPGDNGIRFEALDEQPPIDRIFGD